VAEEDGPLAVSSTEISEINLGPDLDLRHSSTEASRSGRLRIIEPVGAEAADTPGSLVEPRKGTFHPIPDGRAVPSWSHRRWLPRPTANAPPGPPVLVDDLPARAEGALAPPGPPRLVDDLPARAGGVLRGCDLGLIRTSIHSNRIKPQSVRLDVSCNHFN
jgi:hypothetical protein